jgi:hypothetical protein
MVHSISTRAVGKPGTLLERLCEHVISFGAYAFETERDEEWHRAFASIDGEPTRIFHYKSGRSDSKELNGDLQNAEKTPLRSVIVGTGYEIGVRVCDDGKFPETESQAHFGVSGPAVHERIKTLERNGFIERTPRLARSIRVVVESEYLPKLR